ncbi:MAG: hypothetical protein JKY65_00305, partial [Planctomycetes bacterium]|nr:hypothetical protein [Planctomycetota bacterium]
MSCRCLRRVWKTGQTTSDEIETRLRECFEGVVAFAKRQVPEGRTFLDFEQGLPSCSPSVGSFLVALFLCRQHEHLEIPPVVCEGGRRFRRKQDQSREIGVLFGKVRYWRTYMYAKGGG